MDQKVFFDVQADSWDENQAPYRPDPDLLLNMIRVQPGEDVLEIGCGSGWLLEPLARKIAPGRLFALDFSGKMLRRSAMRAMGYPLVLLYAGAEDIPLPDQSVDRVLMVNTFSQFRKPRRVVAEVSRLLRRGGRLDIKYFFRWNEINVHHQSKPALKGLGIPDEKTLCGWFASAGFISSVTDGEDGFCLSARLKG